MLLQSCRHSMKVRQYLSVSGTLLLGLSLLALDSSKSGVGPYQGDRVLAPILNHYLLAEAVTCRVTPESYNAAVQHVGLQR